VLLLFIVTITTITERVAFIESVFGTGNVARNFKNIEVHCPVCSPSNKSKKKLAIKIDDFKNHCWNCGWRSLTLAPLIWKYASADKLVDYRNRFMSNYDKSFLQNKDEERSLPPIKLPNDFRLLAIESNDPDVNSLLQYALSRNLTIRDIWYYKLGYSNEIRWKHRIIVPSFDSSGKINYFVARAINKFRKPKYDNPDYDKRPIVFNEINVIWNERLVLCEGVFDMFKCGDNVVPLLGSDLSEQSALFNMIIAHRTPVALALDSDMWNTKTVKIAKKLMEYDVDVLIVDTRPFIDPGSTTKEQFQIALNQASELNWVSIFSAKLSLASNVKLSS